MILNFTKFSIVILNKLCSKRILNLNENNKKMRSRKPTSGYVKKLWSKEEDAILTEKVSSIESNNWSEIASFLPGRTGKQCRERWHNHLIDGGCKKGDWTTEEDFLIMSYHSQSGTQWSMISKLLQFRSPNDVRNRFYQLERMSKRKESDFDDFNDNTLMKSSSSENSKQQQEYLAARSCLNIQSYTKKVWSAEEDAILLDKVKSNGRRNWKNISSFLPGRTAKQCRERHHNHLLDGIKKGDWTGEEDTKIMSLHARFGNQWSKINKHLPGRSSGDIKNRCKSLERRTEVQNVIASQEISEFDDSKTITNNSKKQHSSRKTDYCTTSTNSKKLDDGNPNPTKRAKFSISRTSSSSTSDAATSSKLNFTKIKNIDNSNVVIADTVSSSSSHVNDEEVGCFYNFVKLCQAKDGSSNVNR